jgi:hypothetical protein
MKIKLLLGTLIPRIEAATGGYLGAKGWFRTRATWRATDSAGRPCPWFTYPAISFLAGCNADELRVLEFGSGAGTEWWSLRCKEVVAVEHDAEWGARIGSRTKATILMASTASEEAYVSAALDRAPFDIIIVDGIHRSACLARASSMLTQQGVIILDDSQRSEYAAAAQALIDEGFRCLPFWGPQPISKHEGCTSIYYRPGNALAI